MQEKDILEKTLKSYNDVFADIVNVLVFNGERVIKEDDLEDRATFSAYKAEGRLRLQERDVSKYWRKSMVKLVLIGLENMTAVSRYMPLRVIGYDGAAYRDQIPERSLSTFDLHTAVSGDGLFKEMAMLSKDKACTQEGKEVVTMRSQFIDNIWKRARDEGEKIGELRGEQRGERNGARRATVRVLRRSIDNMLKKTHYTRDEILEILEVSPEERRQLGLTQN